MSRTYVHAPYWVQVKRAAEDHEWYSYEWHHHETDECNIDDEVYSNQRQYRWHNCTHDIDWSQVNRFYSRWPGNKYQRREYWGSERTRVRSMLNAGKYAIPPSNHRHSVLWDW